METLIGQLTDQEIAALKEQNPKGIYAVTIDGHIGYFRNPTRKDANAAMSRADKDNAFAMFETMARVTKIGGSEALLTDDELFFGLTQHLKVKMEGKKGELLNL